MCSHAKMTLFLLLSQLEAKNIKQQGDTVPDSSLSASLLSSLTPSERLVQVGNMRPECAKKYNLGGHSVEGVCQEPLTLSPLLKRGESVKHITITPVSLSDLGQLNASLEIRVETAWICSGKHKSSLATADRRFHGRDLFIPKLGSI